MAGNRRRRRGRGRRHGAEPRPSRGTANGTNNGRANGCAPRGELIELAPFSVFCALHLGITPQDGYAPPDRGRVARQFELSPAELDRYLEEHGLTTEDLARSDFDLESARLDIQVAPEGISRVELARTMFAELFRAD